MQVNTHATDNFEYFVRSPGTWKTVGNGKVMQHLIMVIGNSHQY